MKKIIFIAFVIVLFGCSSVPIVRPKVSIVYNKENNTAQVIVTQDISSSDKSMVWLAKQSSAGIGDYLNCPSGKMKMTWLNDGKPVPDNENPQAKVLTIEVECI